METRLQLNRHITGAFRHANSWWSWYCRKGSVTPQYPQTWGRMSHSPACLCCISPRGNVCEQPRWVHWTGSWRHCRLQCARPITPLHFPWTVHFKGIDYPVESNNASDVRGLEGLPSDRAVCVSMCIYPLSQAGTAEEVALVACNSLTYNVLTVRGERRT